ncbi:hypothetical protein C1646_747492 [Rhizophagus diaphanus]|nr:hypothetical protein C1646_747492 [Rhizophagus diaphanus] [Rhizophagus sp. MUCL 43196]
MTHVHHNSVIDKLKLWKVEIPGDHVDLLVISQLEENEELSAIGDYWSEKPPKKDIHVIVEPPMSSREQELLDELTSLKALLNKSVHEFGCILYQAWDIEIYGK